MVPILCRISISAKEYVGHIQIYVVPIFIPLSSRSCGLGITTIVEGVSILLSLTKVRFFLPTTLISFTKLRKKKLLEKLSKFTKKYFPLKMTT